MNFRAELLQRFVERSRCAADKNTPIIHLICGSDHWGVTFGRRWVNLKQQQPFDKGYQYYLEQRVLQGKRRATIDAYSRAVRRMRDYFDLPPDELTTEQLRQYFRTSPDLNMRLKSPEKSAWRCPCCEAGVMHCVGVSRPSQGNG